MTPEREKSIREIWARWRVAVGPTIRERGFVNLAPLRKMSAVVNFDNVSLGDVIEIFQFTVQPRGRDYPAHIACEGLMIEEIER